MYTADANVNGIRKFSRRSFLSLIVSVRSTDFTVVINRLVAIVFFW
ncbi:hypothetical protein [Ehrlichia japonica]|uniref:Uncharacterized protein n=1 Tax=Ehrlichia japonica TaxID=391036 RepID=X5GCV7_9RICK|nr:hypothetical protein [Ehrlichia japonica]AHX04922.1 hypothetical protein EHF_0498 [Ehrlichia japonica]